MSPVSTTSLKLPDEIKLQAANAAKDLGVTTHAFMVEAIKQASINAELRRSFLEDANNARNEVLQEGKVHDADKVFKHLKARIAGKKSNLKAANW
jgi:predicted transcriptional regulator